MQAQRAKQRLAMERQIARRSMTKPRPELSMQCRHLMKGDRGLGMVRGMHRHVPHQPADGPLLLSLRIRCS